MISYRRIESVEHDLHRQFQQASPFPHLVLDELYEPEGLRLVAENFPTLDEMSQRYKNAREHKAAQSELTTLDPVVRSAFEELNSDRFVAWLSRVTGVPDLLVDPENLGGGLHQSGSGMYLDVHADFNRHIHLGWHRRLNVIVYLNEGWTADMGGLLEFWPEDMSAPALSVTPVFNRCVLFATTRSSFHGYDTITCPRGWTRRSLAAYYYTATPPPDYDGTDHSTLFRRRPGQARRFVPGGVVRTWRGRASRALDIARHGRS